MMFPWQGRKGLFREKKRKAQKGLEAGTVVECQR